MDYQKAKELRGKSFASRMAENLMAGGGIGESFKKTISEKSKARTIGIKEKFDPLNIAKVLTGGSRLGPALLGKITGRSQEDLKYFAGDPKKRKLSSEATTGLDAESLQASTDCLGRIYELLKQDRDNKISERNRKKSFEESLEEQEELRNQELIKALTARRKRTPKEKRKDEVKQKEAERKAKADNKKSETKDKTDKDKTEPKKETETKKTESENKKTAEKVKKEEVKQTADKQKTEATQKKVEEAKPTAAPVPKPEIKPPPTVAKIPPVVVGGTKGLVLGALVAAGYSKQAQANVMANVEKESNFKPRSEELEKYSAKTLYKLYGPAGVDGGQPVGGKNKVRFQTLQEAQAVVDKGPVAVGDVIYGGRMGNNNPGDGYKYRGRGFLQITGKENYDKVGKMIGVDLVNNPDLANEPEIAAKIIPAFFKLRLKKPEDLESIDAVNAAVGSASEKSKEQRKQLAMAYASELNTGSQIDRASTENKNLKEDAEKDKSPIIVNNNTTTVNKQANTPKSAPVDDKSAYMKKVQGQ